MAIPVELIGRYQILEEVGRGAMGVVYRAQDPTIGRIIAIKTIRLTDLTDPGERLRLRDRLFREAQSAGILSHPNIVTIYDIAEENGKACIFMEFVDGPSLEKILHGPHPPDKQGFLQIFRQTAAALDYAHRKGIVHRDIKPANIMLQEDGQVKITDFGVAKIISQQMTQGGGMMGTPNYMSPEQVQGTAVDGRTDQFGLAVIAYEMVTGEKPFIGDSLATLLYKIVREQPIEPRRFNPTVDPRMEAVLHKALEKSPADRYASCSDFVDALTDACNASPGWVMLKHGASQSMPTLVDRGMAAPEPVTVPVPVAARPAPPALPDLPTRELRLDPAPRSRTLVWVLAGLAAVALILFGIRQFADKAPPEAIAATRVIKVEPTPELAVQAREKPSPMTGLPPPAPQPPAPAKLPEKPTTADRPVQLLTDPPGALITVDGDSARTCTAPCILNLTNGRHTLNTELAGYRPHPKIVNVPADADIFLKLSASAGSLSITSNPAGATIQINGESRPQKTPATLVLAPGEYRVKVIREGVPVEFPVQIKDGEFHTRNVNFQ